MSGSPEEDRASDPASGRASESHAPGDATQGLPEAYQQALVETVVDLEVVTELVRRNLQDEDIRRVLLKLSGDDRDAFISKLSALLRKTSALLLISRRLSDSLLVDVLLPRLVELISQFLDAERCSVFLYDPESDELYTKAAVGVLGEIRFPAALGIAGEVFASGESLLIPDTYAHPRFNPDIDGMTGFRTRDLLCAPLKHTRSGGTEIVGVIQALNKRHGLFSHEDQKLLEALSSHAAAALANALLHEQVKKARAEESRLLEVTAEISRAVELPLLLTKIVKTAALVLEAERVTLYVQDGRTKELWALAGQGEGPAETRCPSHPEIAAAVFATGRTANIADPLADSRFEPELDRLAKSRTRNILCMPVRGRGGEVAAAAEALNRKGGPFTADDEIRLEAFCGQAAIVMENARLFQELNLNVAHMRSLLDASKALSAAVDLDSQLDVILARATEVMEAERSSIFIYDEASGALSSRGSRRPGAGPASIPPGAGIAGHVAQTRELVNVPDVERDPRFDREVDRAPDLDVRSVLCAPMFTHRKKLIGVLQVLNKTNDGSFTRHDEALMEAFASHAAVALDRAQLVDSFVEKQRMEEGLRLAHDIQMGMLPRAFSARREFDLVARLTPARSVGGDLYEFVADEDHLWFVVGDVSGKGVGAALFMAVTKTLMRAGMGGPLSPSEMLSRVNRELGRDNERAMFVTAVACCLNLPTGELAFSNAGHNAPYRLGRDRAVRPLAGARGLPLGVLGDHPYETARVHLEPGDALYLYTDGVTEALNGQGEEFSVRRLEELLEGATEAGAGELVERSFSAVEAFVGNASQYDDITVMAVRYLSA